MDIHEKNRVIFQAAKQYLEENANPLKYQHYLIRPQIHSLNEAFEIAVRSVRDITVTGGVIHYDDNYMIIKECLFDFDYKQVLAEYGNGKDDRYNTLYNRFFEKIHPQGEKSWKLFSRNICGVAEYLSQFDSIDEMFFILNKPQNADERIQLARSIESCNITLWKYKMVCNWLKDIGVNGFTKPDSVLSYIFSELNLAEDEEESVFKAVNLMADDNNKSVFFVDMVFWLIGNSSPFVKKEIERIEGKNKEDFVKMVSCLIK